MGNCFNSNTHSILVISINSLTKIIPQDSHSCSKTTSTAVVCNVKQIRLPATLVRKYMCASDQEGMLPLLAHDENCGLQNREREVLFWLQLTDSFAAKHDSFLVQHVQKEYSELMV